MFKNVAALAFLACLAYSGSARADASYSLTVSGCSSACAPSPFGTITITDVSSTQLTVSEQLTAGEVFANSAGWALAFNLTGPGTFTLSNFTTGFEQAAGTSFTAPDLTSPPNTPGNLFTYAVDCGFTGGACPTGSTGTATFLSFTITNTSGLSDAIFTPNTNGYFFASDLLAGNGKTGNVGAVGGTPITATPEPSSLALFGTGILGAASIFRRRKHLGSHA